MPQEDPRRRGIAFCLASAADQPEETADARGHSKRVCPVIFPFDYFRVVISKQLSSFRKFSVASCWMRNLKRCSAASF